MPYPLGKKRGEGVTTGRGSEGTSSSTPMKIKEKTKKQNLLEEKNDRGGGGGEGNTRHLKKKNGEP